MQKEAAWLLGELNGLVEKGVLDAAAAARLRAHYAQIAGSARPGWGTILLTLSGAALIGLGVILIFAHNWQDWQPGVRVALSLLPLLLGQAASAYALRTRNRAWSEAAGIFTAIAIGASIALIAQTYQFGGDLPRFLLTWLLLAAPLIYLLDSSAVAVLCWLLAMGWALAHPRAPWLYESDVDIALRLPAFLALFSVPLPHLARQVRLDRARPRVAWLLRVAVVTGAIGLGFSVAAPDVQVLLLLYASLAAVCALAGRRYFSGMQGLWGNPLLSAGHLGVFLIALAMTLREVLRGIHWPSSSVMLLPLLLTAAALWLAWRSFRDGDRWLAPVLGGLPVLAYLLPMIAQSGSAFGAVLAHAYVFSLSAALIRSGLSEARLQQANEGVSLLAALVLLRFFDSDLSYVVRGVGFIVTGIAFFAATFWMRRRVKAAA